MTPTLLVTSAEMRAAEAQLIAAGTSEAALMQRAGEGLASVIQSLFNPCRCVIVCGSGNNGGDGRIAGKILQRGGFNVIFSTPQEDVAKALAGAELIIDALLGTGLNKQVTGEYAKAIEAINAAACPVIAVDIPSGINAATGEVMGMAVKATHTITFASEKRGHYLLPGKAHTGTLHLVDIGVPVVDAGAFLNSPALWELPQTSYFSHKYSRGHALVMGGNIASTGASRLTANAALKIGAGAVSIICDAQTLPIYAASLTAVMTKIANNADEFYRLINEPRVAALAIGPGAGVSEATQQRTCAMLETGKPCVVDADALQPDMLEMAHAKTIMTPHAGEFERLFGAHANKIDAVELAMKKIPGILVYKGSDTVIAQRGKRLVINGNAPPTLATAGSGDVLAGLIAGLAAQGMDVFDAACAGVWLHGKLGGMLGRFYTAEDMVQGISSLKL